VEGALFFLGSPQYPFSGCLKAHLLGGWSAGGQEGQEAPDEKGGNSCLLRRGQGRRASRAERPPPTGRGEQEAVREGGLEACGISLPGPWSTGRPVGCCGGALVPEPAPEVPLWSGELKAPPPVESWTRAATMPEVSTGVGATVEA
jgi:hypothetical protein